MLWVLLVLFFASSLLLAGARRWRPEGWAHAWLFLLASSVVFRVALLVAPGAAPLLSRIFIALSFAGALWWLKAGRVPLARFRLGWAQLPFMLAGLLLLVRHVFPIYDVDSLSYHLAAPRWLFAKGGLEDLQAQAQGVYLAYRFVATEEFLIIPSLDGNYPLWAGLMGGWAKLLGLFTVLSLVPSRPAFFRYLAAFLVLVDDHFFFSGQSKFVYLHPLLLGLVVIGFWFFWRGLRGHARSVPLALGLLLGVGGAKYHGLFFGVVAAGLLLMSLPLARYRRWLKIPVILSCLRSPAVWIGAATWVTFLGFNWLETGSPFYPYMANGFGGPPGSAQQIIDETYFQEGAGGLLLHFLNDKYKVFTYPGNLALKYLVVLLAPAFLLLFLRLRGSDRRRLELVAFGFLVTAAWILMCNVINYETSKVHGRYPRFVFLLTVVAIGSLGAAFRNWKPFLRWRSVVTGQHLAGLALLAWIALTLDTRYFNITRAERPGWADLAAYWREPGPFDSTVIPEALKPLLYEWMGRDIPQLRQCLLDAHSALSPSEAREVVHGRGMIVVDEQLNWPNIWFGGNAFRPDENLGSRPDLSKYRLLVVSKLYVKQLPPKLAADGVITSLAANWKDGTKSPLCESPDYFIYRL